MSAQVSGLKLTDLEERIVAALAEVLRGMGPTDIAETLTKDDPEGDPSTTRGSVQQALPAMIKKGVIVRAKRGRYKVTALGRDAVMELAGVDNGAGGIDLGGGGGDGSDITLGARTLVPLRSDHYEPDLRIVIRNTVKAAAASPSSVWRLAEGDEHDADKWAVAKQLLFDLLGVWLQEGDEAVRIEGLSMKRPNGGLDNGQLVFYRPSQTYATGLRYVIEIENLSNHEYHLVCKRLQVFADGSVVLVSDNRGPGFSDELLKKENGHLVHERTGNQVRLHVKGKVLWPRENDDDQQIRLITQTIEQLARSGVLGR